MSNTTIEESRLSAGAPLRASDGGWERFSAFRIRAGLSQNEVAEQLGVSQDTVSKWERGVRLPSWGDIPKIAGWMGIEAGELAGELAALVKI